jgi:hypothetical protein
MGTIWVQARVSCKPASRHFCPHDPHPTVSVYFAIMPSHLPSSSCLENSGSNVLYCMGNRSSKPRPCATFTCVVRRRPWTGAGGSRVAVEEGQWVSRRTSPSYHQPPRARAIASPRIVKATRRRAPRGLAPWCLTGTRLARGRRGFDAAVRDGGPRQSARRPDKGHLRRPGESALV